MTTTYAPISTTTLSTNQTTINFTSIPQTYTDLVLVVSGVTANNSASYIGLRLNDDSGSNYSTCRYFDAESDSYFENTLSRAGTLWGTRSLSIFHINNYSNTTTHKTLIVSDNNHANRVGLHYVVWHNSSKPAINKITLTIPDGGGFASTSTLTLYGIKAET